MVEDDGPLGLVGLTVPLVGAVQATGDPFEPYRLADPAGETVSPVTVFLAGVRAGGGHAAVSRAVVVDPERLPGCRPVRAAAYWIQQG